MKLAEFLEKNDITYVEMAKAIKTSPATVCRIVNSNFTKLDVLIGLKIKKFTGGKVKIEDLVDCSVENTVESFKRAK